MTKETLESSFELGDKVSFERMFVRSEKANVSKTCGVFDCFEWVQKRCKKKDPKEGVLIGFRNIFDYKHFDNGVKYYDKTQRAALVAYSDKRKPIYVPLTALKKAK